MGVLSCTWLSYPFAAPPFQLSLNFKLWQLIPHLCSSSQFCIDAMATRSYGFSRTTMCRMRSSTPRHSSPPHDTHLTSGSSCVFFSCPLRSSNFVSSQNPRKIEGRRNRLSSLDCCAFAPPATLSADETELKGQPVEAPFIANLFSVSPPRL